MKTNLEKWNYYKSIIDNREELFVQSQVVEIPEVLYSVYPNGNIGEKIITKVAYNNQMRLWFDKKPTKVDVAEIKAFAESTEPLLLDNIRYHYEEKHSYGKSLGTLKLNEINVFFTKEQAESKSSEIKEIAAREELLLQNGHIRCGRCRKITPTKDALSVKIISIATYGHAGKMMQFCSSTCAAHEQWAHEG